jgi:hypothetical protein
MSTITVWLLVSLGSLYGAGRPFITVERFATAVECERVAQVLRSSNGGYTPGLQCVQAAIAKAGSQP